MGLTPIDRQIKVATADLEPDAIAALLAKTAREALAQAQGSGAAARTFERFVNGRQGIAEEQVVPPGPIVYVFSELREIAIYAMAFLEARAPKASGRFAKSFFCMADGVQVAPEAVPPFAQLIVTNDQPYARKIEVGHMTMSVPHGLYQDAARAVRSRFGGAVKAQVRFIDLAGAYRLKRGYGRKHRMKGDPLTYPALVVDLVA